MGERLTEQIRVNEDGLRVVKICYKGRTVIGGNAYQLTVPYEKATANYVPAAAVIRRWHACSDLKKSTHARLPVTNGRKAGMTSNHHAPYGLG